MAPISDFSVCEAIVWKIVGNIKSSLCTIAGSTKLSFSQALEVIPCCSGPAPIIIEAQLGLELVGRTARACIVELPSSINRSKVGVMAFFNPSGLSPSKPITTTWETPELSGSLIPLSQDQRKKIPMASDNGFIYAVSCLINIPPEFGVYIIRSLASHRSVIAILVGSLHGIGILKPNRNLIIVYVIGAGNYLRHARPPPIGPSLKAGIEERNPFLKGYFCQSFISSPC